MVDKWADPLVVWRVACSEMRLIECLDELLVHWTVAL